jgi:hypothetical protein
MAIDDVTPAAPLNNGRLDQLIKIVHDLKRDVKQLAEEVVDQDSIMSLRLQLDAMESAIRSKPASIDVSMLQTLGNQLHQLNQAMNQQRQTDDIFPPSTLIELDSHNRARSASPTKITGHSAYTIINHLLDIHKSVAALRHQISDLELHQNSARAIDRLLVPDELSKLICQMRETMKDFDIRTDMMDEMKVEMVRMSQSVESKIQGLTGELEQLQLVFHSSVNQYTKDLQELLMEREVVMQENERLKRQVAERDVPSALEMQVAALAELVKQKL